MNKKIKRMLLMSSLLVVVTACGNSGNFDQSMQKTKEAIIEKKFEQAEGFVEMALESKPKDEEAKNYQTQLKYYINALDYIDTKEYDKAKSSLDAVIKVKNGSDKLVDYAKKEKKELDNKQSENKTTESKETKEENAKKEEDKSSALWTEDKKNSLRDFMSQFSNKMGQNYKEYGPSNSVDLYGVKVPGDIFNGQWTMAINNQPVQVEWSETGEGSAPYQLVAVYSDADTQPYLQKHVYFFVIEGGQPKVYVTQQNQGNNENYLHFSETQNPDIKAGFSQIVGGDVSKSSEQTSDSTNISSFDVAKEYLLNNKNYWNYATQEKNASNIEVISVNENNKEQHQDSNGNYYSVVINTNDDDGSVTGGGKQFRVYTDGKIFQRAGMHDFSQVYP